MLLLPIAALFLISAPLAQPASQTPPVTTVFTGQVLTPDGAPAANAVVISTGGGRAVTRDDGSFELVVELAPQVQELRVTAALGSGSAALSASVPVEVQAHARSVATGTLTLQAGTCAPAWLPTFGGHPGVGDLLAGVGFVTALAVFDDGSGPALFIGGNFEFAGSRNANGIARWDGKTWSAVGVVGQVSVTVRALVVFDDGSGPALYAGGDFKWIGGKKAKRVARWDGTTWSALGKGLNDAVYSLAVFDDGAGPALFAGGFFDGSGPNNITRGIAKWDGNGWLSVGGGVSGSVYALAVHTDTTGTGLYVGGAFSVAGSISAKSIARWDGSAWSSLDTGLNGTVRSFASHDDGSGPALFVSGWFNQSAGPTPVAVSIIARWNGATWSSVGALQFDSVISVMTVHDDGLGGGPALFAGGLFSGGIGGGPSLQKIAKWDGIAWTDVGSGVDGAAVSALGTYDDGQGGGPELYVGGSALACAGSLSSTCSDGTSVSNLARWNGQRWAPLGKHLNAKVEALAAFDDGSGPSLYAGGAFQFAGTVALNHIAERVGNYWSPLGAGTDGPVHALATFTDASGPGLYAAGSFTAAGNVPTNHIARWDGSSWFPLGPGIADPVHELAVYDDGSGPALYAVASSPMVNGSAIHSLSKWDGATWTSIRIGNSTRIETLLVHDDGSGTGARLFAGGSFQSVNGLPASHLAAWDGTTWAGVGGGLDDTVFELGVYYTGSGSRLVAGGSFLQAGNTPAKRVASWDGTSWSALGSGMKSDVLSLASFQGPGGKLVLYAGGTFKIAGGLAANRIASWDGVSWTAVGMGVQSTSAVTDLLVFDDSNGSGPGLFVGGDFISIPQAADAFIGKWGGCPTFNSYCTQGMSANGCQARLSALGAASASDLSGFFLSASNVEGNRDGLFFFGTNGRQAQPWGNGTSYQCVVPPVTRASQLTSTGSSGHCGGTLTQDLNALWCPSCPKPAANPGVGAVVQAQLWYRDPQNTSNQTSSLSHAIEFTIRP